MIDHYEIKPSVLPLNSTGNFRSILTKDIPSCVVLKMMVQGAV